MFIRVTYIYYVIRSYYVTHDTICHVIVNLFTSIPLSSLPFSPSPSLTCISINHGLSMCSKTVYLPLYLGWVRQPSMRKGSQKQRKETQPLLPL